MIQDMPSLPGLPPNPHHSNVIWKEQDLIQFFFFFLLCIMCTNSPSFRGLESKAEFASNSEQIWLMVGTVRGSKEASWDTSIGTHTRPCNKQREENKAQKQLTSDKLRSLFGVNEKLLTQHILGPISHHQTAVVS